MPETYIAIQAKSNVIEVFRDNPDINEIILLEKKENKLKEIFYNANKIKIKNFDLSIIFPESFSSALIMYLAGVPYRIGYNTEKRGFLLQDKLLAPSRNRHLIKNYIDLIQLIGKIGKIEEIGRIPNPVFIIPEEEQIWARNFINNANLNIEADKSKQFIGINAGAVYGKAKRWDSENFRQLAERLQDNFNLPIMIFGSKAEIELAHSIGDKLKSSLVLISAGKTNLKQLGALFQYCKVIITNDTGPMHLASALNIPTIAIFGSTNPDWTRPWGEIHTILYSNLDCSPCYSRKCIKKRDYACLTSISVDEVYNAVLLKLESKD